MQDKNISAVLLSAGSGTRLNNTTPKQFLELNNKAIIVYSLEKLLSFEQVNELIIAYGKDQIQELESLIEEHISAEKRKIIKFVLGGKTRQESVYNAIQLTTNQTILLHESARPLASLDLFRQTIEHEAEALTTGTDIPFTVLKSTDNKISEILKREEIFNVQLPQKFNRDKLIKAHELAKAKNKEYTDDSSLYFDAGYTVSVIKGEDTNIKVTNPKDMIIAEQLLKDIN